MSYFTSNCNNSFHNYLSIPSNFKKFKVHNKLSKTLVLQFKETFGKFYLSVLDKFPNYLSLVCPKVIQQVIDSSLQNSDRFKPVSSVADNDSVLVEALSKCYQSKWSGNKHLKKQSIPVFLARPFVLVKPKFWSGESSVPTFRFIISHARQRLKTFVQKVGKALSLGISTLQQHLVRGTGNDLSNVSHTKLYKNFKHWSSPDFQWTDLMGNPVVTRCPETEYIPKLDVGDVFPAWKIDDVTHVFDNTSHKITAMVEVDITNMFYEIPTKQLITAIYWFFNVLLGLHKTWCNVDNRLCYARWGKSVHKTVLNLPWHTLLMCCIWSVEVDNCVQWGTHIFQQCAGVPIGGLLSAQLAEIWALWVENSHRMALGLHKSMYSFICKSTCISVSLQDLYVNTAPPEILKYMMMCRYRDNLLLGNTKVCSIDTQLLVSALHAWYMVPFTLVQQGSHICSLGINFHVTGEGVFHIPNMKYLPKQICRLVCYRQTYRE